MLREFTPRLYQETILATAALNNTLVVLPTGMGKTGIALLLAAQRLHHYPASKVLVLAPTKPLVQQHEATFKKHLDLPEDAFALFTGAVAPKKRAELAKQATIIFSTPQGLENDIVARRLDLAQFSLLIIDEAHRATGEYAYTFIAKQYHKRAEHERILALTASPGDTLESITEVCKHLSIAEVEVRTEEDPDVKPYVQQMTSETIKVELPERYKQIRKHLHEGYLSKLRQVKDQGYLTGQPSAYTKSNLLELSRSLFARMSRGERELPMLRSISLLAEALKLQHAIELIETQGVYALHTYMASLREQSVTSKTKAAINVVRDLNFRSAFILAERLVEAKVRDPKMVALEQVVQKRITKGVKAIIFSQFRDQGRMICAMLAEQKISCELFVGQAKKRDSGLSQAEQHAILERFRAGEFSCLVATSVAEEGLDIPEVDYVIFYEPIPSAIRTVQRRGRTGRHAKGNVIVLVARGTRDEAYQFATRGKQRRMHSALAELKRKLPARAKERTLSEFGALERPITIHVDNREQGSAIVRELTDLGVAIELRSLEIGDYLLSDRVVVELKNPRDFVTSLIDGRLLSQARDLRRYARPIMIVEGDEDIYAQRNVHPNAIRGALASLAIDYRISVLRTASPKDTAALLAVMARREQKGDERDPQMHTGKPMTLAEQQEYLVAGLPGIGPRLATPLLERFLTIEALATASEEQLRQVDLIGPIKAKRLRELFVKRYEGK